MWTKESPKGEPGIMSSLIFVTLIWGGLGRIEGSDEAYSRPQISILSTAFDFHYFRHFYAVLCRGDLVYIINH